MSELYVTGTSIRTPTRTPINNNGINEMPIVYQHQALVRQKKYNDAVTLLDTNKQVNGFRAERFNELEGSMLSLENYLLEEPYVNDTFISDTEPAPAEMENKQFWLQEF